MSFSPSFGAAQPTWNYASFLLEQDADQTNTNIWAAGELYLEDSGDLPEDGDDFRVVGNLKLKGAGGDAELKVEGGGSNGKSAGDPAMFHAIGTVVNPEPAKGVTYSLRGWIFPDQAGNVARIEGGIALTKGLASAPEIGPSREPVGTVGLFRARQ